MSVTDVSFRYARSLYDLANETSTNEKVFYELRAVSPIFDDAEVIEFLNSGVIQNHEKVLILKKALGSKGVSELTDSFILYLAERGRIQIFNNIVGAYQEISDKLHGVTRGTVKSSSTLSPEERKAIEERVAKVTGKKVILNYIEDPKVIGGLIAEVDGFRFDDTIQTHLIRMKEELNRSVH